MMPQLVSPSSKYKQSYIEALHEYQQEGLSYYKNLNATDLEHDFDAYVEQLLDSAANPKPGRVPQTCYWLVEGDTYLGRLDIRHELNERLEKAGGNIGYDIRPSMRRKGFGSLILKLGLEKAKELGLTNIIITCDIDNVGSNKIIKENGGKLKDVLSRGEGKADKCRYLITV